jgi:hypothetical protein
MPCINYKFPVFFCKFLCACKFSDLHASRFAQFDARLNIENRFATTLADVNVDRSMIVAVKRKLKTIFLENLRHSLKLDDTGKEGNILLPIVEGLLHLPEGEAPTAT